MACSVAVRVGVLLLATTLPALLQVQRAVEADGASEAGRVLITAVFPDGYAEGEADEAVQLWNVGAGSVDLDGWALDDGEGQVVFPAGARLLPGERVWVTADSTAFTRSFGHVPRGVWSVGGTMPAAAGPGEAWRLIARVGPFALRNDGEVLRLLDDAGANVDAVAYASADADEAAASGWRGRSVHPYHAGALARSNQVLYRKLDPNSGRPLEDGDTARDWAADPDDPLLGRRVRWPGWDAEAVLAAPAGAEAEVGALLEVAIAPDGLYVFLMRHIRSARAQVDVLSYTFENADLAEALAERARSGARVRLLVDGNPAGGHDPAGRWCLDRLAEAGAEVRFMDNADGVRRRYRSMHAKVIVIDGRTVLIGTENPTLGSAPAAPGAGRRGAWMATDAEAVVRWAQDLVDRDMDVRAHVDLRPFQARDPVRGAPLPGYEPPRLGGGPGYSPIFSEVLHLEPGTPMAFEMISAPESAVAPGRGLLGLLASAGPGDQLRVAQLREPVWWGGGETEGAAALNPRLQAYVNAARRGARVRVMLDGYFDDPEHANSNAVAATYLRAIADAERLDLEARTANPTGRGLHAKIVLASFGTRAEGPRSGERWVHLGSINGSEVASKANREVALQVRSDAAHDRLALVFDTDWVRGFHTAHLPVAVR